MRTFKNGDRIRYVGNKKRDGSQTPRMIGLVGTVQQVDSGWLVAKWDDGQTQGCYPENVVLYVPDPVQDAIALLKQHGTVTFIPKFKPISMNLNNEYEAVINKDHVKVGCQKFSFSAVLALAEAVQEVKAQLKQ